MVSASEIFMGFSRYYNSLSIIWRESLSTHTGRILAYFDSLGRMLGYRIISETKMRNLVSCPKNLENKKIDMMWWRFNEERKSEYELAVESQQSPDMDFIRNDIRKLVVLPAKLRVLYCCAKDRNKILKAIKEEIQQHEINQCLFLAIIDPWVGSSGFDEGILAGILLNENGQIKGEGTAKVREIIDGLHRVRMFLEAEWQEK